MPTYLGIKFEWFKLFEVEVSRIEPFRSLVKALSVIVEEGTFLVNEAQIKLLAMDPSHVAMVDFELPSSFFDSYSCVGEPRISINIKEFLRFLDRVDRDEVIRRLVDIHYVRNDFSLERGTFRVRGDVLEIMPAYDRRHGIKPGLTGLAQLYQGYDDSANSVYRKLRWDVRYIKKMGLKMDMWLIFRTIWALFKGET